VEPLGEVLLVESGIGEVQQVSARIESSGCKYRGGERVETRVIVVETPGGIVVGVYYEVGESLGDIGDLSSLK